MNQPEIITERLILSPFTEKDLPAIFAYAKDPAIARMVFWSPHQTIEDSREYLKFIENNTSSKEGRLFFVWAVRKKEDGVAIGSIDFKQPYPHVGQFDYALATWEWNKGIMTEAARAVVEWSFQNVPLLQRFQTFCIAENWGSRKVMEKCGLSLECIRRKGVMVKGEIFDTAHYVLVR